MSKLIMLCIFITIIAVSPSFAEETSGEIENQTGKATVIEARTPDVQTTRKCPKCGLMLYPGHEHTDKEEEKEISAGTDLCIYDKYAWRGLLLNEDPVFQPCIWVSFKGLTLNVWANMDLTDIHDNRGEINEIDYTAEYAWSWKPVNLSAGIVHYSVPNTDQAATTEIYGSAGYDTLLQPTLTVYYDFQEADGFYGKLGISHGFELPKFTESVTTSLDLSAEIGLASNNWNSFYYGADHTALTNLLLTAGLNISLGEHFKVNPSVNYSLVMDGSLRSKVDRPDFFYWGFTVSASL